MKRPKEMKNREFTLLNHDRFSFQLVYRLNASTDSVKKQYLLKTTGINSIRIRHVELIASRMTTWQDGDDNYLSTKPGLFPDLLRPMSQQFTAVWGQYQSIWIDFTSDVESSGDLNLCVSVMDDDHPEVTVYETKLLFHVLDTMVPEQRLIHTEWFHSDCLADYYHVPVFSEKHWEAIDHFMAFAGTQAGINMLLTPVFTPPLDTKIGGERTTVQLVDITYDNGIYQFGFEKLKRWCNLCKKNGIHFLEIAHLFTQWGAKATPKIIVTLNGKKKKLFGWKVSALSNEYQDFLHQFLPELQAVLQEFGFDKEHVYFHLSDEPGEKDKEQYRKVKAMTEPLLKGYHVQDAMSSYTMAKELGIQIPVPASDSIEEFYQKHTHPLWTYYCIGQYRTVPNRFFAMPSVRNAIMGVLWYLYGIQGFLHWGYNFYSSSNSERPINPFFESDGDFSFPSGDAFLVYPGEDLRPYSSIRNEVQMDALYDLRVLEKLESFIGREQVCELLQKEFGRRITFTDYPKEDSYILQVRKDVREKIAEMSKKAK